MSSWTFTKYMAATGEITGSGSVPRELAAVQPRADGQSVFNGAALQPQTHWFSPAGQPVAYTSAQAAAKAARPRHATRWSNEAMAWLDERTPEQKDADAEDDVRQARRHSYPPVEDQLDALWHAMGKGQLPKVPEFYDAIAAVKAAHPKPEKKQRGQKP